METMRRDLILTVLSATLIVALVSCSQLRNESEGAGRPDGDLQEAALRWAFANADTDLENPAVYCIATSPGPLDDGVDPDAEFLERFRRLTPPVRPVSACRFAGAVCQWRREAVGDWLGR